MSITAQNLIASVPDVHTFYTVDELREQFHGLPVERERIGASRAGEPVEVYRFGNGTHHALLLGLPHPDEPIGSNMLVHVARSLVQYGSIEGLDYTWHLVPYCDPDGSRLNQGWYKGPFTAAGMARHYYRPIEKDQFEWSFPISYKKLHFDTPNPEARAVIDYIDRHPFRFFMTLHNCTFGGAYYYVSHPCPSIYDDLYRILQDYRVPIHRGEPEVPYLQSLDGRVVYKVYGSKEAYDFYEQHSPEDELLAMFSAGTCSDDYVIDRWGTFTLVCELPYYTHPSMEDTSATDRRHGDVLVQAFERDRAYWQWVVDAHARIQPHLVSRGPFRRVIEEYLTTFRVGKAAEIDMARSHPKFDRPATVAEVVDVDVFREYKQILALAQFCRMLSDDTDGSSAAQALLEEGRARFEESVAGLEKRWPVRVIPVRELVSAMLRGCLVGARYAQEIHRMNYPRG